MISSPNEYLFTAIITNNPDFQSNTSSLGGKRNLLVIQKLDCTRIITKEAKIMDLEKCSHKVISPLTYTMKEAKRKIMLKLE